MAFAPLKKLIKKRLEGRDLRQGVTESKVADKTKELLKSYDLAAQAEVLKVKDQKIILKTKNSSVAQEIQLHQQQIINAVNQIEKADIKKIIFKSN